MNSLNAPLVSVIIPVYNCERYLGEAIESVLTQTYRPLELIVINDDSTDNTAQVAQRFEAVHYIHQSHSGAGPARNRGVDLASGTFLAFLDADDLWVVDKLTRQMATLSAQPDLEAIFGNIQQFYSPDIELEKRIQVQHIEETMIGYHVDTLLIRAQAFQRVGYFQPDWHVGQFVDWFSRAQEQNLKIALDPQVLAKRRIHDANTILQKKDEAQLAYLGILRAALNRRRAAAPK